MSTPNGGELPWVVFPLIIGLLSILFTSVQTELVVNSFLLQNRTFQLTQSVHRFDSINNLTFFQGPDFAHVGLAKPRPPAEPDASAEHTTCSLLVSFLPQGQDTTRPPGSWPQYLIYHATAEAFATETVSVRIFSTDVAGYRRKSDFQDHVAQFTLRCITRGGRVLQEVFVTTNINLPLGLDTSTNELPHAKYTRGFHLAEYFPLEPPPVAMFWPTKVIHTSGPDAQPENDAIGQVSMQVNQAFELPVYVHLPILYAAPARPKGLVILGSLLFRLDNFDDHAQEEPIVLRLGAQTGSPAFSIPLRHVTLEPYDASLLCHLRAVVKDPARSNTTVKTLDTHCMGSACFMESALVLTQDAKRPTETLGSVHAHLMDYSIECRDPETETRTFAARFSGMRIDVVGASKKTHLPLLNQFTRIKPLSNYVDANFEYYLRDLTPHRPTDVGTAEHAEAQAEDRVCARAVHAFYIQHKPKFVHVPVFDTDQPVRLLDDAGPPCAVQVA